jgi:hypothetical protein
LCAHAFADSTQPAVHVPSPEALSDTQVLNAINHGIDFLIGELDKKLDKIKSVPVAERGNPRNIPGEPGELFLEAYALLHVGKDVKDQRLLIHTDRVKLLVDVLTRVDSESNYTTALQALALSQLPPSPEVRRALSNASAKLLNGRTKDGGYGYVLNQPQQGFDLSNSQYAMLGVWAAADWGITIPGNYWSSMNDFWRNMQQKNGGWTYSGLNKEQPPTPSMTAAGIASLFVCDEFINRAPRSTVREDPAIDNGLTAMVAQMNLDSDDFYYLYAVERVALATGKKFFGQQEWYRPMAVTLLKHQHSNGSFESHFLGSNSERATCYAILLLARGRAPVLMNKLQYDGAWNLRPRDSAKRPRLCLQNARAHHQLADRAAEHQSAAVAGYADPADHRLKRSELRARGSGQAAPVRATRRADLLDV